QIDSIARPLLLTSTDTTLSAWLFDSTANPSATLQWTLDNRAPLLQPDFSWSKVGSIATRVVSIDLDSDSVADLVTATLSAPSELHADRAIGGAIKSIASFALPKGVDVLSGWTTTPRDSNTPKLLVSRTDGFVSMFGDKLTLIGASTSTTPGIAVGGYYAS